MSVVLYPSYYRVILRDGTQWRVKGSLLCSDRPIGLSDISQYGLTVEKLLCELFRLNGGKAGYYLANFKTKTYYYCGVGFEDVQAKLRSLGIGRVDPLTQ